MINVYYGGHSDITDHMKTRRYISLEKTSVSTTRARDYFKIVSNLPSPTAEGALTYHSVKYNFSFRSNDQSSKFLISKLTLL